MTFIHISDLPPADFKSWKFEEANRAKAELITSLTTTASLLKKNIKIIEKEKINIKNNLKLIAFILKLLKYLIKIINMAAINPPRLCDNKTRYKIMILIAIIANLLFVLKRSGAIDIKRKYIAVLGSVKKYANLKCS